MFRFKNGGRLSFWIWSNNLWDVAIFLNFRDGNRSILDVRNHSILLVDNVRRVKMHHFAKFLQSQSVHCGDTTIIWFLNVQPSAILDLFGTQMDHSGEYLVVSIGVQNVFAIGAVFLIVWNFHYLHIWLENALITPSKLFGLLTPWMGSNINQTPKGTSLHESTLFEPSSMKIRQSVWPIYEFSKKGQIKKWLYLTHLSTSLPWTDLHQNWYLGRGCRHNQHSKFFSDQLRDVDSVVGESKISSPPWHSQWLLILCCCYRTVSDSEIS